MKSILTRSLTSLQQRLVKTGGRLVKYARYHWLLLAESHLTLRLFASMLRRILALPLPAGKARQPGETNLDDGGEMRERCLRNRFDIVTQTARLEVLYSAAIAEFKPA